MEWSQLYTADQQPTLEAMDAFVGNPLWNELNGYVQKAYATLPKLKHSGCSWQPGWNVKYQKSGKSLCTLYPMPGFFMALVVIGPKEMTQAELCMPMCCAYTQELFARVEVSMGGKWLMMHVTDADVLEDVRRLVGLRREVNRGLSQCFK
jgi:hypothetical protein